MVLVNNKKNELSLRSFFGLGTVCVDKRMEPCYLEYMTGICSSPVVGMFPRQSCCCTVGLAWGHSCSRCPRTGSQDHQALCGNKQSDVNECVMFPDICSNGRCKNTLGSFECICDSGFALDETGFKENILIGQV